MYINPSSFVKGSGSHSPEASSPIHPRYRLPGDMIGGDAMQVFCRVRPSMTEDKSEYCDQKVPVRLLSLTALFVQKIVSPQRRKVRRVHVQQCTPVLHQIIRDIPICRNPTDSISQQIDSTYTWSPQGSGTTSSDSCIEAWTSTGKISYVQGARREFQLSGIYGPDSTQEEVSIP